MSKLPLTEQQIRALKALTPREFSMSTKIEQLCNQALSAIKERRLRGKLERELAAAQAELASYRNAELPEEPIYLDYDLDGLVAALVLKEHYDKLFVYAARMRVEREELERELAAAQTELTDTKAGLECNQQVCGVQLTQLVACRAELVIARSSYSDTLLRLGLVEDEFERYQNAAQAAKKSMFTIEQIIPGFKTDGGTVAGVLLDAKTKRPYRLDLFDAKAPKERMTWQEAMDWTKSIGADLPTRKEQALLFANLVDEFSPDACWSNEPYAGNASCAWYQNFSNGNQWDLNKANELLAVAVRRSPIT